jgi:hypothetical protein
MTAQTIYIDSTFTTDGEIFPFEPNDTIYGLSISGSVTLSSDTSLVRVILTDEAGQEWMVYEAYPMILPCKHAILSGIADEYIKAFEYLKMDDSVSALNILEAIPGNFELTSAELLEHSRYEDYFDLLLSVESADTTILAMDSVHIALCYDILNNSSGLLEGYVRNLLTLNDSLEYSEIIIMPEPGLKSGKVRQWPVKKNNSENLMKIYPNPAKKVVIIETRLKEEPQGTIINVIDNKGIKLRSYPIQKKNEYLVIPLSDFQSGVLFCQLINRNSVIESRKLVILK